MILIDCFKYAVFFKTPKKKKKEMKQMFGENFATALIFMMAKTFWYTEFVLRYVNVFKKKVVNWSIIINASNRIMKNEVIECVKN